jgi:hypothetical protein
VSERSVPVLTDVIPEPEAPAPGLPELDEEAITELQTQIATQGFILMERLVRDAFREAEMTVLTDVISRLRQELPELVDDILRERLGPGAPPR